MPIYEYQCEQCGHQLEALQKVSEEPLTHCPACQSESLIKLMSAASFQLKGTGWYATDFRTKPNQATDNSENKTKEEAKDSTEKLNDTSTASKDGKETKDHKESQNPKESKQIKSPAGNSSTSGNNGEAA